SLAGADGSTAGSPLANGRAARSGAPICIGAMRFLVFSGLDAQPASLICRLTFEFRRDRRHWPAERKIPLAVERANAVGPRLERGVSRQPPRQAALGMRPCARTRAAEVDGPSE